MYPFPAPPPSRLEFFTIAARGVSHLQQDLQIEVLPWSPVLDMQRTVGPPMTTEGYDGFHRPFFIVCWIEFIVAILLLCARCYTAFRIVHRITVDFYLAVGTFILGVGSMSMLTVAAAYGLGVTMALLSHNQRQSALMYGWINQFIALFAIGVGKLAIVSFLTRVQGYQTRFRAIALWTLAASNLLVNIITVILIIVQCSPVERLWDAQILGQCPGRIRIKIFGYFQAYSAFVDFALALYPILIFSRVQAFSIPTRIGLCVLMGCGLAAGACAIVKTVKLTLLIRLRDPTRTLADVILWNE
ncbi:hypothetical protein ATEIFO6365_0007036300 [Aspergillus terreus]|uniref:Rhodopsin domain-containing protein n=1 Tax=Aspergillus terreus TaxID=33178 RepID=A0A5M3Z601_ASPTE|nr:hypothetical protein ATETN484_0009036300 [Aspergillus terreus]GFF17814.1 hypothetical protein ATEIFO6365_0007036300 [Aspergillus terreus]